MPNLYDSFNKEETIMPLINIKVIPHTWYLIEEVDLEGWGDGGKPVTPDMLKAAMTEKV